MLNYVGALVLNYLIFDSLSYWRDTSSPSAKVFPQGKNLPDAATWPVVHVGSLQLPFGLIVGAVRRRSRSGCSTRARASASRCR